MSFNLSAKEFDYLQKNLFGEPKRAARAAQQEDELNSTDLYLQQHRKPEEQGLIADFTDSVQMGAWQGLSDLSRGLGVVFNSDWLNQAADWAAHNAEANRQTMSSKMQQALGQSAFDGWDSEKGEGKGVLNAYWWAGNFGALLGQQLDTVATLGAGKIATTGLKIAGKMLSRETAEQIGKAATQQAARFGIPQKYHQSIGVTAVMSAMQAGGRANQVFEEIDQLSDEQLAQLDGFRQDYWDLKESEEGQGLDDRTLFDTAKARFKQRAGRDAAIDPVALATDLTTNAISGLGGGFWGAMKPAQTLKDSFFKGGAIEALTEGMQGAAETYAVNDTARNFYDTDRTLTEGMGRNVVDGMVLGGVMGAGMGAMDTHSHNRTMSRQKKRIIEAIQTGDPVIDEHLRNYAETINNAANDIDELISAQQLRAKEAELRTQQQAQAQAQAQTEQAVGSEGGFATEEGVKFSRSAMKSVEANIARGREAMTRAILDKADVKRGMYNQEFGWVDFVWGDDGTTKELNRFGEPRGRGLSHIFEARMRKDGLTESQVAQMLTQDIVETIAKGRSKFSERNGNERLELNYQRSSDNKTHRAILTRNKGSNAWVLTGFEVFGGATGPGSYTTSATEINRSHSRDDLGTPNSKFPVGGNSQLHDKTIPTQTLPTRSRQDLGATGFELNPADEQVGSNDPSLPTHTLPTRQRQDMGATGSDNLLQTDEQGNSFKLSRSAQETPSFYETEQQLGGKEAYESAVRNGETELDYRQWVQVRTPEFKAWFGDWENDPENASKVVNPKTGEPLVVYHGTDKEFSTFDRSKNNPNNEGFYFSDKQELSKKFAGSNGRVLNNFLNIRNPDINGFDGSGAVMARSDYSDGGIFTKRNSDRYAEKGTKEIIAFDPNQIKSATDNTGAFDVGNEDIRFSKALQKPDRLEKLRQAKPIEISGNEIQPSDDLRQYKRNALEYGKSLRGAYTNKDTGEQVVISREGINEVIRHDYKDADHLQSVAAIPKIIEEGIYIDTVPNEDLAKNPHIKEYEYYLTGLKIGATDYTVRAVVGVGENGNRYYDHKLTKIEKGELLSYVGRVSTAEPGKANSPLSDLNDKRLLQILQQQNANLEQTHNQLKQIVGGKLAEHFNVVSREQLGITDPTIEAGYDPKTGKIFIVEENIRDNGILSRDERLKWVAWHELAHRGVQVKFAKQYQDLMAKIDQNSTIRDLANAIQQQREETKNNRTLAIEEALAELNAAYSTGKMEELKARYGIVVPLGREKSLRAWFEITAERIRDFVARLFGKETAEKFSQNDLIKLIKDIQSGMGGEIGRFDGEVKNSLNEDPNSSFAKAVDEVFNSQEDRFDNSRWVGLGTTPDALIQSGIDDKVMKINFAKIAKIKKDHPEMTADLLKQIPRELNNPVAVFKNMKGKPNSYVVLTELTVKGNERVIAALHAEQEVDGLVFHKLASAYGKDGTRAYLENMIEKSEVRFVDKQKASRINSKLQLLAEDTIDLLFNKASVVKDDSNVNGFKFSRTQTNVEKLRKINENTPLEKLGDVASELANRPLSEWKALMLEYGKRANSKIFDALAPIKYAEDKAGITDHTQSAYTAARLAAGSASISEATMLYGLPEYRDGIIQRKQGTGEQDALFGILQSLGNDANDFLAWVAGNRADKLMKEGRENHFSQAEIDELKALNKGKEAKFEQARQKLMAFNTALLDLAENAGLINKEERAKWEDKDFYIPFYRETEDGDAIAPYRNKGLSGQSSGIKRLKGSDKAVNDLLENVITNATKLIDASVKNLAMTKAVTNLADTGVITLIENPTYLDWKKLGSNKHGADKDGGVAMVRIEGKEQLVRINDVMLFNAITSIDQQPLDYPLRKLFAGAKRVLTATVTSMPNFIVRNFLRDMAQAWVVDRNNGFKLGIDSLKGLKDAYKRSGSAIDLMFAGASFGAGYVNGGNPQEAAVHIRKHLRKQGKSAAEIDGFMDGVIYSKDQLSKVLDQYFRVAQASENANRIAVYDRAIASGKSKAQAALESKDLMDFSMHGSAKALRVLADVLPFFNARLQGMSQLGRAFKENPRELAKRGAMIALASVALSAMNQGEDWYEEQSDEIKDNFWLANLGGQIIKIPKPFELGVVFGTVPERLYRTMSGADSTGRFKERLLSAISNTLALNPIPQAVKPIFEVYNNYDSFRGREIETLSDRRLLKEARYDDRTSLVSRSLAGVSSAFGLSPKQTDHLIHGYFGTLGMYVLGMSDVAIRQAGGYGELPAKNWQEYPVLEAVFGGDVMVPRKYTRQMNDYYRFLNQVSEISATVKSYEEDGKTAQAATLKLENQRLLAYKPILSQVQKQLKVVKGEMDMIQNSQHFNAEQKRQRLDRLRQHKNAIVRQVVERMEAEDF